MHNIAIIGLGRMGGNMSRRLAAGGIRVEAFDAAPEARESVAGLMGIRTHETLVSAISQLPANGTRLAWVMLPAGAITEETLLTLSALLRAGDVVIDGGNANYLDSMRRAEQFAALGIEFVDCGVSGGVWGLKNGYSLMFGASKAAATALRPFVQVLAPASDRGWVHCGPVGSGHFAKMIHNGIEYGMMQAMAEGFSLLAGKEEFGFDLGAVGEAWRDGSVVRSWLLDLTVDALKTPGAIGSVAPYVSDSGEGRWTVDEAVRQGTPIPVISMALMSRFDSQGKADTANKILSLMRKGFGGHAVKSA
jgi:6-phosphogluconate dehydrogenase